MFLDDLSIPPQHAQRLHRTIRKQSLAAALAECVSLFGELINTYHPVEIFDLIASTVHRAVRSIKPAELDGAIDIAARGILPHVQQPWSPEDARHQMAVFDAFSGLLALHVVTTLLHNRPRLRQPARVTATITLATHALNLPPLFSAPATYTASRVLELEELVTFKSVQRLALWALRIRLAQAIVDVGADHMYAHARMQLHAVIEETLALSADTPGEVLDEAQTLTARARAVLGDLHDM